MPKNINWNGVMQSIIDFWLPILGWVVGIIVVIACYCYCTYHKENKG